MVLKKLFIVLLLPISLMAQWEKNYVPIVSNGKIPEVFSQDPAESAKTHVQENKVLSQKEATDFYSKMNFIKFQLFKSGKVYLANPLTYYIDSIVTNLLITEPKLQGKIHVHLTRFAYSNAFCFPDGNIFINVALVARMETKAELAFVLAHEIAHYAEQHNVKDLKRLAEIQKQEFNFFNKRSSAYRSLKFSRESEFDADAWAAQLVSQAGYDITLAAKALERLKSMEDAPASLDFQALFNNEHFSLDTAWISGRSVRKNKSRFGDEEDDPIASGRLGDLFQTHPDIDKRVEAIAVIARTMNNRKVTQSTDQESFKRVKELASFEVVENNYQEQDYVNAILNAARLLKTYPENNYLHMSISRSLFWLSYFKELNTEKLIINGNAGENGYDFYKLCTMIHLAGLKECKKLAYAYTLKKYDTYPDREPFLFYLALTTDNYVGKNAATNYYKDYLVKYPTGAHIHVVKSKLQ